VLGAVDWYAIVDWAVVLVAPAAFILGVAVAIRDFRRRKRADRRGVRAKAGAVAWFPINGARYAVAGVGVLLFAAFGIGLGVNLIRDLRATRPAPVTAARADAHRSCVPGYSVCLSPRASDYDCANGFGDGPRYVNGPIRVTGSDPFSLDFDGNGIGCEY
jgi:hypothetical protein